MSQAPEDSPNELTPAPHVRRLNRVPLLIAGLLLSVLLAAVAYSYYARLAKTSGKPEEAQKPEAGRERPHDLARQGADDVLSDDAPYGSRERARG